MPLSKPKEMTVLASMGLGSKKRSFCATCRVRKVTMRCQLVSVVAAFSPNKRHTTHKIQKPRLQVATAKAKLFARGGIGKKI
jgi:hypothetical protein